jgi:hypothetical protein
VADEIVDHEQRRSGQGNGDQAAPEPGLLESGSRPRVVRRSPCAEWARLACQPARPPKNRTTNAITAMVDRMTFALPRAFKPSLSSPIDCC